MNLSRSHLRGLRLRPLAASVITVLIATAPCALASTMPSGALSIDGHTSARYAARLRMRVERAQREPLRRAPTPAPHGTSVPVTSCADDDDPGTLRNVLAAAAEGDIIDMSALTCSTITLTQGAIDTSAIGEHQLYDVTLQGPGRDLLTIDGGNATQILTVGGFSSDKGTFTANDLTIANGTYSGSLAACVEGFGGAVALNRVDVTNCHASGTYDVVFGGAVDVTTLLMTDSTITDSSSTGTGTANTAVGGGAYASDLAVLVDSVVSGNTLTAPVAAIGVGYGYYSLGGGMYVRGDLMLTDSTISGNSIEATADGENAPGGGIDVRGIVTITGSTIDNNTADGDGGGLYKAIYSVYGEPGGTNPTTSLTVTNSTFSGNVADRGGAIATSRPLYLANSTIADNHADGGAGGVLFVLSGVTDSSGVMTAQSTVIAANTSADGAPFAADLGADDVLGVTGANNFITAADAAITLPADTLAGDPLLLPLADNGGATRTMAPQAGSPVINAGNNAAGLPFDQRGENFARVAGAAADIGAFEVQQGGGSDTIFSDGFDGGTPPATREFFWDDGMGDTNQGPPSSFDPDMLWGNYFVADVGGQYITEILIAFGPTFPSLANGPVTFWVLQDTDGDGDPRNAYAVASVQATPDLLPNWFSPVTVSPTFVHDGFFIGVSAKLQGGEDKPARVDTDASGEHSWFFYAPDIAATIDDLAAAPFGARNDDTSVVPLPGAFMVRAQGSSTLSD